MNQEIVLKCSPLVFYTQNDEDLLFNWFDKIKCIEKIQGIGKELYVVVDISNISYTDICDFIGIFKRYKFKNYQQLQQLDPNPNWNLQADSKTKHRNVYPSKTKA